MSRDDQVYGRGREGRGGLTELPAGESRSPACSGCSTGLGGLTTGQSEECQFGEESLRGTWLDVSRKKAQSFSRIALSKCIRWVA